MKALIGIVILAIFGTISQAKIDHEDLKYANVGGKYSGLLHVLKVPADTSYYGVYYDYGYWRGNEYAGYTKLSPGYWVYVSPRWYIWAKVNNEDDGCGG